MRRNTDLALLQVSTKDHHQKPPKVIVKISNSYGFNTKTNSSREKKVLLRIYSKVFNSIHSIA